MGKQKNLVPAFLLKTYDIIDNPQYYDIVCWQEGQSAFIVKNINRFTEEILPQFFKHRNYTSFVRQLNMYDFHKSKGQNNENVFTHTLFKKGCSQKIYFRDKLFQIQRKEIEKPTSNKNQFISTIKKKRKASCNKVQANNQENLNLQASFPFEIQQYSYNGQQSHIQDILFSNSEKIINNPQQQVETQQTEKIDVYIISQFQKFRQKIYDKADMVLQIIMILIKANNKFLDENQLLWQALLNSQIMYGENQSSQTFGESLNQQENIIQNLIKLISQHSEKLLSSQNNDQSSCSILNNSCKIQKIKSIVMDYYNENKNIFNQLEKEIQMVAKDISKNEENNSIVLSSLKNLETSKYVQRKLTEIIEEDVNQAQIVEKNQKNENTKNFNYKQQQQKQNLLTSFNQLPSYLLQQIQQIPQKQYQQNEKNFEIINNHSQNGKGLQLINGLPIYNYQILNQNQQGQSVQLQNNVISLKPQTSQARILSTFLNGNNGENDLDLFKPNEFEEDETNLTQTYSTQNDNENSIKIEEDDYLCNYEVREKNIKNEIN